jgi:hypothetical protein
MKPVLRLNIELPAAVHRLLKVQSAVQGKTMTTVVKELILSHLNPGDNPAGHVGTSPEDA